MPITPNGEIGTDKQNDIFESAYSIRRLTKKDVPCLNSLSSELAGIYGHEAVMASSKLFHGNSAYGMFDCHEKLVGWIVKDANDIVISKMTLPEYDSRIEFPAQDSSYDGNSNCNREEQTEDNIEHSERIRQVPSLDDSNEHQADVAAVQKGFVPVYAPDHHSKVHKKMTLKAKILFCVFIVTIIGVLVFIGSMCFPILYNAISGSSGTAAKQDKWAGYSQIAQNESAQVIVASGDNITNVEESLAKAGFVSAAEGLYANLNSRNALASIQAGTYTFLGKEDPDDIATRLITGQLIPAGILGINEGDTLTTIASAVDKDKLPFTGTQLKNELSNVEKYRTSYRMLDGVPQTLPNLEGYISSGVYDLTDCKTAEQAANILLEAGESRFESSGKNPSEWLRILEIASIVEQETYFDEDKGNVASTVCNRLAKNDFLQLDTTILYAENRTSGQVLYADTEVDSPYNTYTHKGLPPGPICSGITDTSIAAAENPPQSTFYYFVLKDKQGHLVFSSTAEQFAIDRAAYLKLFGYSAE